VAVAKSGYIDKNRKAETLTVRREKRGDAHLFVLERKGKKRARGDGAEKKK